jgi:8-oxo-dGTP pyrophosphatase MutT (NUDIX family)
MSDAVAAIIRVGDRGFLMQLRDRRPDIWYPDAWGCFGGAVEPGESQVDALRRELREELELEVRAAVPVSRFEFDLSVSGLRRCYRAYYLVEITEPELAGLVLHEGARMAVLSYGELGGGVPVTPYDAFALHLHCAGASGALVL